MPVTMILGLQHGDEGKGRAVDFFASKNVDLVLRPGGGNNAGHTVVIHDKKYKFHLIPSGVMAGVPCYLGNGMVIDAEVLLEEIKALEEQGCDCNQIKISSQAHLILPTHKRIEEIAEEKRERKIGTTKRGIGPTYADKAARCGIRIGDCFLADEILIKIIETHLKAHEEQLKNEFSVKELFQYLKNVREVFGTYVIENLSTIVNDHISLGHKVLLEGAQGTLLDLDHGSYPFVTSSSPCAGGMCVGSGIGPTKVDSVIGVFKAYSTKVGEGPFPTELGCEIGEKLRQVGKEFGTTTGRARRCGWLDLVALKYAVQLNGVDYLVMTKMDVLDSFEEIKICTSYNSPALGNKKWPQFPTNNYILETMHPEYISIKGWNEDTTNIRSWNKLPTYARAYISYIQSFVGVPIVLVGVGEERDAIVPLDVMSQMIWKK